MAARYIPKTPVPLPSSNIFLFLKLEVSSFYLYKYLDRIKLYDIYHYTNSLINYTFPYSCTSSNFHIWRFYYPNYIIFHSLFII